MRKEDAVCAAAHFIRDAKIDSVRALTAGLINSTWLCAAGGRQYVLQRLSAEAFPDRAALMENIAAVTEHIGRSLRREGVDPHRRVLSFLPCDTGGLLWRDAQGGSWRAYDYVGGAASHDRASSPQIFYEAGRGFGDFARRLADFPAQRLHETVPHFHDTPARYAALLAAAADDVCGRAGEVQEELAFFAARRALMPCITSALADGTLPLRAVHNDTKLNNILFDAQTQRALCVIDLDTVMPGSLVCDFGDAIRSGAATASEDAPEAMALDMALFRRFTDGYLETAGAILTPNERRMLPLGAEVITCELAMRFLTDHLAGDRYFRTDYAGQNLARARAQMRLLGDMEQHRAEMCAYVEKK